MPEQEHQAMQVDLLYKEYLCNVHHYHSLVQQLIKLLTITIGVYKYLAQQAAMPTL